MAQDIGKEARLTENPLAAVASATNKASENPIAENKHHGQTPTDLKSAKPLQLNAYFY
ncbi:hypothetical protein [Pseudoalteromonas sp. MMG024]|uniref:hypothetical protein n=1 Tax=Pseudoalteromonas sp. MMG024 TaxID=2909980 RepID=UPI001F1DDB90|nr:hypothetical protein [Pseudoalteromonas sp. MMG024]MCF6456484.1 hypothetical protein [Pseudoalteromonas sp. MMG024]